LKSAAPFPVGAAVTTQALQEPAYAAKVVREFSELTAEWEMKMEALLTPAGGLNFAPGDRLVEFAAAHGLRMHGHTLVWHQETPAAFTRLEGDRGAFGRAYARYIREVAGHYRGAVRSWDVVNEAVAEDPSGLRPCLWSRNLGGEAYVAEAFHLARSADDQAVLFLNDYGLEETGKRRIFLGLCERLLRQGAPLGGIGSQTHLDLAQPAAGLKAAVAELASLGLPVHISELDVSTRGRPRWFAFGDDLQRQAALVEVVVESFMRLPERQRFAITLWGVRDSDSWLRRPPYPKGVDRPLLFDADSRPKPAARAFVRAASGR
jgi:endo-1,4-beta-xylanase